MKYCLLVSFDIFIISNFYLVVNSFFEFFSVGFQTCLELTAQVCHVRTRIGWLGTVKSFPLSYVIIIIYFFINVKYKFGIRINKFLCSFTIDKICGKWYNGKFRAIRLVARRHYNIAPFICQAISTSFIR